LEELLRAPLAEPESHEVRDDVAALSDRGVRGLHLRASLLEALKLRAELRDGVGVVARHRGVLLGKCRTTLQRLGRLG